MSNPLIGPATSGIHVMSWNVRRRMPVLLSRPTDRWDRRMPRIRDLLQEERPTLLGAQEALPEQVAFLRDCLGRNYRALGRGRGADGGGEACPILYDDRRLELLDQHQHALSDHPHRPGSRSWGNLIPRIVVMATFRGRRTGRTFLVINTHLDHLSRRSRARSAQAIRQVVSGHGLPAVVTGDLNEGPGGTASRTLCADGPLMDSWDVAEHHASQEWGTFPNYRRPRRGGRRLDRILVTPNIRVTRVAVNPRDYDGGWPSDHLPVQAELLPAEGGDS